MRAQQANVSAARLNLAAIVAIGAFALIALLLLLPRLPDRQIGLMRN